MVDSVKQTRFLQIVLTISLIFIGTFHEYLSCAVSLTILVFIIVKVVQGNSIRFRINISSIAILTLILFYMLSCFWAIDSGMAFIGFLKFLPVFLYLLMLMQQDKKDDIIEKLPYIATIMTIIATLGAQIPVFETFFSVSGRLAGFFQYPNTFALFLLVSELIVISKTKLSVIDIMIMIILIFGLIYTGSRTVFVLSIISNLILLFYGKSRRVKLVVVISAFIAVFVAAIYLLLSGNETVFSRIVEISPNESTFIGRWLYFFDALPVVLRNPFGLGYMGYYYVQQSIQSGVYSVMYIHNDFLQILLDVGWIPFLMFAVAIIKSVFSRKIDFYKKVILVTISLHCCFDFNLQFIAMFFIFLLFMDFDAGKEIVLTKNKVAVNTVSLFLASVCLYGGIALSLSRFGQHSAANKIYPWNTKNETNLLVYEKNIDKANQIADDIISRNEYVSLAYSVKARYAYSQGDFAQVIKYKNLLFEKAPFAYDEYEEYCYMLVNGISLYTSVADEYSINICKNELMKVKNNVENIEKRLSKFGAMIDDQPVKSLPDELKVYIETLEGDNDEK